ncbi:DUF3151 domain-containing protein [Corynebacterium sanguinis]|uniref:DUF3151 domain-containing protein n=1 Tax=Corynebacterium sanguinis TaxID=2594913 RepID=A0A838WWH6_9CORY|nr:MULTISPECIES: DUF3151 domain-containing protein [Corynebacterium]MBA4506104.1 DUF3151 domain-containing protein [Corynebacterium sanguinis]MCT1413771.1 DUF3151 domain-containing protein [Corynebacterium sanguinis]MCT1498672.1 DUF3151 domain-containing protein [Corynebacterium sanguinis]MCT1554655.1 DUF3151 domain-containing protein [Corynebacterium sanguinis]MCT1584294.1 DUF3151 domain-containing protein [Corynebacterium sanguinis]
MEINDMLAPPPVHLPEDPADNLDLLDRETALSHPESPAVWAARAAVELTDGDVLIAYAYARTGYHRSLDRLRANGWKGWGPVPASHAPNRGVLKAIAMLALASEAIGDTDEYDRCRQMLSDADPGSVDKLL